MCHRCTQLKNLTALFIEVHAPMLKTGYFEVKTALRVLIKVMHSSGAEAAKKDKGTIVSGAQV